MYHFKTVYFTILITLVSMFFLSLANAQDNDKVKVGGYVKTDFSYIPSDSGDESETDLTNARVKISGKVNEKTSYTIFFDAVRDDVLLDAYVSHVLISTLSFKAGQFKTPYSTENLISNAKIAFMNRPYMKKDTSPTFRDRGVTLNYKYRMFDATVGMMNGSGQNTGENNNNKSVALRLVAKVLPQLNLSGNFYTGHNNTVDNIKDEFVNIGADGSWKGWEYAAEYAQKDHEDLTANSYFAWVSYDFKIDSRFVKYITPAVRAERSDPDNDVDDDAKSRYTLGLSAHMAKKYADSIMLNYEIRDVETGEADDMVGVQYIVIF